MSSGRQKFYVVWSGTEPGIYRTWDECKARTIGVKASRYKSFPTREEAEAAFAAGPPERNKNVGSEDEQGRNLFEQHRKKNEKLPKKNRQVPKAHRRASASLPENPPEDSHDTVLRLPKEVSAEAWAVDAACSGNPGKMEYRGVDLATGAQVFHFGPMFGTNNVGEFLAIVHALALIDKHHLVKTVYSDSRNALLWVKAGKCRTTLAQNEKTAPVYDMIHRAESWLSSHPHKASVIKWQTSKWGEIPADFGRK